VNALYQTICRDNRHGDVTLLTYEEVDQREFACWSMAQAPLDKKNAACCCGIHPARCWTLSV
jgi:hypothetical protein